MELRTDGGKRGPHLETYTLKDFDSFMAEYQRGNVTPDELQRNFAAFTQAKDHIKAQLMEQTVKALKPKLRGLCPPTKKSEMVSRLYHQMVGDFAHDTVSYGMNETLSGAIAKQVGSATHEDIAKMASRITDAREYRQNRRERILKPETLSDFEDHKRVFGSLDRLDADQQRRYDELKAQDGQARREKQLDERARVAVDVPEGLTFQIVPGFHTRRREDIWIVTLDARVERDVYEKLNIAAKRIGGRYTRKYGENPAGFQFRTHDQAQQFIALQHGEVSVKERMKERRDQKLATTTDRLLELARRLEERSRETLDAPRQTNTVRRADMASAIEQRARSDIQFSGTLRALAEAARDKELKFISRVTASTQVRALERALVRAKRNADTALVAAAPEAKRDLLRSTRWEMPPHRDDIDHAEFPHPWAHASDLRSVCISLKNTPGAKQASKQLLRLVPTHEMEPRVVKFKTQRELDYLGTLIGKARVRKRDINHQAVENLIENARPIVRLSKMGIEDLPTLRAALREYFDLKAEAPKADPVTELERSLVGQNVGVDFFPTPDAVIRKMMDALNPWACHTVLEPSAGKGDIAKHVRDVYSSTVHCCEISPTLRSVIEAKGLSIVAQDFLEYQPEELYERIVMNPPWGNGKAIDHVRHAYSMLAEGGRLVAVIGNGFTFRTDTKHHAFRTWLEELGAETEDLGEAFSGSDAFRKTGAKAVMVTLVKPYRDEDLEAEPRPELPPAHSYPQVPRTPPPKEPAAPEATPLGQLSLFE